MLPIRAPLLISLVLATGLLSACGKVAPNKGFEGEGVYPMRYPYEPDDLYNNYYPEDPALRSLSRAERQQRQAQSGAATTEVIVRDRVQTAPGSVMNAPAGSVIQANPTPRTAPAAPSYSAPSYTPSPSGVAYPSGYKPL